MNKHRHAGRAQSKCAIVNCHKYNNLLASKYILLLFSTKLFCGQYLKISALLFISLKKKSKSIFLNLKIIFYVFFNNLIFIKIEKDKDIIYFYIENIIWKEKSVIQYSP